MVTMHVDKETYRLLEEAYERANGPLLLTKEGCPGFIIMRTSDHEEAPLTDDEMVVLRKGYEAARRGEVMDARESIAEIRVAYGL